MSDEAGYPDTLPGSLGEMQPGEAEAKEALDLAWAALEITSRLASPES